MEVAPLIWGAELWFSSFWPSWSILSNLSYFKLLLSYFVLFLAICVYLSNFYLFLIYFQLFELFLVILSYVMLFLCKFSYLELLFNYFELFWAISVPCYTVLGLGGLNFWPSWGPNRLPDPPGAFWLGEGLANITSGPAGAPRHPVSTHDAWGSRAPFLGAGSKIYWSPSGFVPRITATPARRWPRSSFFRAKSTRWPARWSSHPANPDPTPIWPQHCSTNCRQAG